MNIPAKHKNRWILPALLGVSIIGTVGMVGLLVARVLFGGSDSPIG